MRSKSDGRGLSRETKTKFTLASSPAHPRIRGLRPQGQHVRTTGQRRARRRRPYRFARFQHLARRILSTNCLNRSLVTYLVWRALSAANRGKPLLPRLCRTVSDSVFYVEFLLLIPRTPCHIDLQHWDEVYGPKYEISTKTECECMRNLTARDQPTTQARWCKPIPRTDPLASKNWPPNRYGSRTDAHGYDAGQFAVHNARYSAAQRAALRQATVHQASGAACNGLPSNSRAYPSSTRIRP
ncbi:uncharacterized protein B0H18DRAFT_1029835 [Fomitopsis serialis]|uniref:uncharacterized protein n=1 Tax=Fomitopsis serialis TaxID=139415 RepID=UPI0020083F85|nr:uncharacterized protein B0H18DRAFT_1029835 [Neoantrodia serialis]KAH9918832.1 hypothetical protein B0H18DRAFT_1029835 [Neoantrodia serialis]